MGTLDPIAWLAIGLVIAGWLMATLHVLSAGFRDEEAAIAHAKEVQRLRSNYAKRLRELSGGGSVVDQVDAVPGEFDIVEDEASVAQAA